MFSHEGTALELLVLVFGVTGLLLVAWFIHHQYELRSRKHVKKQHGSASSVKLKAANRPFTCASLYGWPQNPAFNGLQGFPEPTARQW